MELRDTWYSFKWAKQQDESPDDYEQRYYEMTKLFLDDYNSNGEIVIINYGFPITKSMLVRARKYLENPFEYREKILTKIKEDFIEVTSDTSTLLKNEVNVAIAGEQLVALRKKRHIDYKIEQEMDRLQFCKCALCQDTFWINIVYPMYFREKYFKNGFIDKGGHTTRCIACLSCGPKEVEEKHQKNLFKKGEE